MLRYEFKINENKIGNTHRHKTDSSFERQERVQFQKDKHVCDEFWIKKRQRNLTDRIHREKMKNMMQNWKRQRSLRHTNLNYLRNCKEEHTIVFGDVVYTDDFLKQKFISNRNFKDDRDKFDVFGNYKTE